MLRFMRRLLTAGFAIALIGASEAPPPSAATAAPAATAAANPRADEIRRKDLPSTVAASSMPTRSRVTGSSTAATIPNSVSRR